MKRAILVFIFLLSSNSALASGQFERLGTWKITNVTCETDNIAYCLKDSYIGGRVEFDKGMNPDGKRPFCYSVWKHYDDKGYPAFWNCIDDTWYALDNSEIKATATSSGGGYYSQRETEFQVQSLTAAVFTSHYRYRDYSNRQNNFGYYLTFSLSRESQ